MKHSLCRKLNVMVFVSVVAVSAMLQSCEDESLTGQPDWLNNSIYGWLEEQGNYQYTIQLIDDLDMTDVFNYTGSKTLFVADDEAFEEFFESNDWGVKSYSQLSTAQKNLILNSSTVNNAYLIELLSSVSGNPPVEGYCMRRETALSVYDSVARIYPDEMPEDNEYWDKYRGHTDGIVLFRDNTSAPMIHLLPKFMSTQDITDEDLTILTNGKSTSTSESWINGVQVLTPVDITCKNGYIQKVAEVLTPPLNMAEIIHDHPVMSTWASMLDRYTAPIYDSETTTEYNRLYDNTDSVFVLKYFAEEANGGENLTDPDNSSVEVSGYLSYDPEWNQYMYTNTSDKTFNYDCGAMLVPSNEAMETWWNGEGQALQDVYGTLDAVDINVLNKLINVNMLSSFVDHIPSKFESITNDAKVSMGVTTDAVDSCFMGCNGVVYLTNVVYAPAAYRSVSFPALVRRNTTMAIVYWAIEELGLDAYLNSMDTRYSLIIPTDTAFLRYIDPVSYQDNTKTLYQFFWSDSRQNVGAYKYDYNMTTGEIGELQETVYATSSNGKDNDEIMNRLSDILENSIIVGDIEDGSTYFSTKGGGVIKVEGTGDDITIGGSLQAELDDMIDVTTIYDLTDNGNGKSYVIEEEVPMTTEMSVYETLMEHEEFSRFLELLEGPENMDEDSTQYIMLTSEPTSSHTCVDYNLSVFDNYNYTVYVPTNAAIEEMHDNGYLPYWDEYDAALDNGVDTELSYRIKNKIINFVKYHIQDNSIYIGDDTESGLQYETAMLNSDIRRFYSVTVDKDDNSLTVTDQLGNERHVVTTDGLYNDMCREYDFNGDLIYASSYAVVHQIDGVLLYDESQLEQYKTE